VVTRRGVPTAVLVPFEEWQAKVLRPRRTLKELLLAPDARTDNLVPPRRKYRHRKPPKF
jgi:antitoxin (DNA-binding transcriptional repressor) of toxin-antitoxin stability system